MTTWPPLIFQQADHMAKKRKPPAKKSGIRDRVKELRRVPARELIPHAKNWRVHTSEQEAALRGILNEVGFADAVLAREDENGKLILIDGHLRRDVAPDMEIPVLILDVDEVEAAKLLATHDPIAAMAETNDLLFDDLTKSLQFEDAALAAMMHGDDELPEDESLEELEEVNPKPLPDMAWVLVGVPTVRYGEISEFVERLSMDESLIVETAIG